MAIYVVYATTADLAAYLGVSVGALPTDASRLLTNASAIVKQLTLNNIIATNVDHMEAAKLATCAQVESWMNFGEQSMQGNIGDFKIGELSMNFTKPNNNGGVVVAPMCRSYLGQQGLLYRGIGMRFAPNCDSEGCI